MGLSAEPRIRSGGSPAADNVEWYWSTLFADLIGDRRRDVLLAAAQLFAERGYRGTSVRDIAQSVGVLGGSLYHHFKSKEALFLEVHGEALKVSGAAILKSIAMHVEPWDRLRAACRTHLEIQLDPQSLTVPLMEDLNAVSNSLRSGLIKQRNDFELMFTSLVADLNLSPAVDRSIFRVTLLTLLNQSVQWYRPGGLSPTQVADQIIDIYRYGGASIATAGSDCSARLAGT